MNYAFEKLMNAVLTLAKSKETHQDRLANAYLSGLLLIRPDDLPEDIREDFFELKAAMEKGTPRSDEGTVVASVRDMSEQEASNLIDSIVSLYADVARAGGK